MRKHRFKNKISLATIGVFVFLVGLGFHNVQAASDATLYFNPTNISVHTGDAFTVDVMVNPASTGQVNNIDLSMTYDQTSLRLDDITSSNFAVETNKVIAGDGTALYSAGTAYGAQVTTTSTFATLHFHALAVVTASPLTILTGVNKSGVYSDSVLGGTNLLGSVASGFVTVSTPPTYSVSGTITGLSSSGIISLKNNGTVISGQTSNGSVTFLTGLNDSTGYNLTVFMQPTDQTCTITNGSGTISGADVANVQINCLDSTSNSSQGDTTAPVRSQGLPSGSLSAGTANATLSLQTDENATCKYSTSQSVSFASMVDTFGTTGTTSHSTQISGLTNGASYQYYVKCQDTSGNANADDFMISFSIDMPTVSISSSSSNDSGSNKKDDPSPRYVHNSKSTAARGTVLVQSGARFSKNSPVLLYFAKPGGGYYTPTKIITSKRGTFSVSYLVNKPAGKYGWYAVDTRNNRKSKTVYYKVK